MISIKNNFKLKNILTHKLNSYAKLPFRKYQNKLYSSFIKHDINNDIFKANYKYNKYDPFMSTQIRYTSNDIKIKKQDTETKIKIDELNVEHTDIKKYDEHIQRYIILTQKIDKLNDNLYNIKSLVENIWGFFLGLVGGFALGYILKMFL